ncbi:MAG: class I SAM-dependent methyltransferase [Phycisphaerae bacterium]|nr:class I SAM-dependent methyltransferase [Phycisphaerae bacterium]
MNNPWLSIPLADYEGHMALPEVGQSTLLSGVFESVLRRFAPASVAVLGCAGGNGFEYIDPNVTRRIVGVDINPDYIAHTQSRFGARLPGLELYALNVQVDAWPIAPVELVFAGLLFEYVEPREVLDRIRVMLRPGGVLVTVLQLPNDDIPEVTPSPFKSLEALDSIMRLVPPEALKQMAEQLGYRETDAHSIATTGGKQMMVQTFTYPAAE